MSGLAGQQGIDPEAARLAGAGSPAETEPSGQARAGPVPAGGVPPGEPLGDSPADEGAMGADGFPDELPAGGLPGGFGGPARRASKPGSGQLWGGGLPGEPGMAPFADAEELFQIGELFAENAQWADLRGTIKQLDAMALDEKQQRRLEYLRGRLREAAHDRVDKAQRLLRRAKYNANVWNQCVSLLQEAQAWDPDGPEGRAYKRAEKLRQQLPERQPASPR